MADCEEIRWREMPNFNLTYIPPELRPYGTYVDTVMFWTNLTLLILGLVIFALAKYVIVPKSSPYWRYLDVRFFPMIVLVHMGGVIALLCGTLMAVAPFNTFPCWGTMAFIFVPSLLQIPPSIRLYTFYREYRISRVSVDVSTLINNQLVKRASLASANGNDAKEQDESIPIRVLLLTFFMPNKLKFHASQHSDGSTADNGSSIDRRHQHVLGTLKLLQKLSSGKGTLVVAFCCLLPTVIIFLALVGASEFARSGCNTCPISQQAPLAINLIVAAFMPIIFNVGSVMLVRKAPDPLFVVKELKIAYIAFGIPSFVFLILAATALRGPHDFDFRQLYQMCLLFFCLTQSAAPAIIVMYWYFQSKNLVNASVSASEHDDSKGLTRNKAEFDATLKDPALHQAYMDHLMGEHSIESLRFHDEVQKWALEYNDVGPRTAHVRARKIVSLFVGDDAVFPINLKDQTIHSLRQAVGVEDSKASKKQPSSFRQTGTIENQKNDPEGRPIDHKFFEDADREILEMMRLDSFARFQQTSRYKELRASILGKMPASRKHQTRVLSPNHSHEAIVASSGSSSEAS